MLLSQPESALLKALPPLLGQQLCSPSLCTAPCLALASPWRCTSHPLLCPGPTRGFSKAISRAVLEKHKIYPGFPARTSAEPEDSYMQTGWRCWRVASFLRQQPPPSFTCCTANPGGTDTHSQLCRPFRKQFYWLGGVTTVITTLMSFIKPSINAYALNCIAFHLLYLTWRELKK